MRPARRLLLRGAAATCATPLLVLTRTRESAAAEALPALVARVRRSVVAIGSLDRLRNPPFRFRGTGFVVGDGNTIVTCAHVVPVPPQGSNEQPAMAVPGDGSARAYPVAVQAISTETDLAVLRFQGPPLPAVALAEPDAAAEGLDVALIGFPIGGVLGLYPATHRGVIAAIVPMALPGAGAAGLDAGAVQRLRSAPIEVLQLDATAYPGNSGSPLIDARDGRVLGVVSMVTVKGSRENALSAPSGISYAVPVRHLITLVPALR
jgi:S1-C subfamily serine protease